MSAPMPGPAVPGRGGGDRKHCDQAADHGHNAYRGNDPLPVLQRYSLADEAVSAGQHRAGTQVDQLIIAFALHHAVQGLPLLMCLNCCLGFSTFLEPSRMTGAISKYVKANKSQSQ